MSTVQQEAFAPRARIEDLSITFDSQGADLYAVRNVSLDILPNEILVIIGESGSGKSVLASALMGLITGQGQTRVNGSVEVCGVDMMSGSVSAKRRTRRHKMGVVFQDPMSSLNPTMTIGRQMLEVANSVEAVRASLQLAGIADADSRLKQYPHQLSGGLRQRVMIAMAVCRNPQLIIADEPTTALDVTVQAQVLQLIRSLRDKLGASVVLITHDFGVAAQIADRVAVMYAGRIVEVGSIGDVMSSPSHPYTEALIRSRVTLDTSRDTSVVTLPGEPPDPRVQLDGCAFSDRCWRAIDSCGVTRPHLGSAASHPGSAACLNQLGQGSTIVKTSETLTLAPTMVSSLLAIECKQVSVEFALGGRFKNKRILQAVKSVNLSVRMGESVAIVGESGSGKSTLLRVLAGMHRETAGTVTRPADAQMIFQDAGSSLTPWMTVGELVGERLLSDPESKNMNGSERRARVAETLRKVGLRSDIAGMRAYQLSGGQRQRVAIARAIIVPPQVLLCDEPTSALDPSLAAAVLNLLQELRRDLGMSIVFITHDLAAARYIADRIVVIYLGEVVESGAATEVCDAPTHPYTKALVASVPSFDDPVHAVVQRMEVEVP